MSLIIQKSQAAVLNIAKILLKPPYMLLAVFAGFATLGVILWSLNFEVLRFVIFNSGINVYDKFTFFTSVYWGIFSSFDSIQAVSMVIFSALFGVNVAVITFALKHQPSRKSLPSSSAVGLGAAILGGGCIACGTSIVAPLLTSLGVFGATTATQSLGAFLNISGSLLILWSLYKLGLITGTIHAQKAQAS